MLEEGLYLETLNNLTTSQEIESDIPIELLSESDIPIDLLSYCEDLPGIPYYRPCNLQQSLSKSSIHDLYNSKLENIPLPPPSVPLDLENIPPPPPSVPLDFDENSIELNDDDMLLHTVRGVEVRSLKHQIATETPELRVHRLALIERVKKEQAVILKASKKKTKKTPKRKQLCLDRSNPASFKSFRCNLP
jgi:hypothetical protein